MTNLIASTFLYMTALESGELKSEYGARVEYIAPNGWGVVTQVNDHAHDSAVDGVDGYAIRQWKFKRFSPSIFAGIGQNIEDERFRTGVGVRVDATLHKHFDLQVSVAAQREYGSWKGSREPMAAVITIGGGWRF